MKKFAIALAVVSAGALLAVPVSATSLASSGQTMRVAQADVTVRTTEPVEHKRVIIKKKPIHEHERIVVGGSHCRTVTTHIREGGRMIVKKVRKCD